jgi:ABC-type anion transport system duplicated permease subunit
MIRVLVALVIAPLAVAPVLVMLSAPRFEGVTQLVTGALLISYPSMILFGLPAHLVLSRTRYTSLFDYTLLAGLLGALFISGYCAVAIVFDAHFALSELSRSIGENVRWGVVGSLYFGLCSASVGAVFWRIAVRRQLS